MYNGYFGFLELPFSTTPTRVFFTPIQYTWRPTPTSATASTPSDLPLSTRRIGGSNASTR